MLDLLLKNAKLYTGDGSQSFSADIGIKDDIISQIGKLDQVKAQETIDLGGRIVAPGFIDMHAHDDIEILDDGLVQPKLRQGVTTIVNGNCGMSFYPLHPERKQLLLDYVSKLFSPERVDIDWSNYAEYSARVTQSGLGINVAGLVGHGSLRIAVMGFDNRPPEPDEMREMEALLEQMINEGIFGLSSGLLYPPGSYAEKWELERLTQIVANNNLIYSTHIRNESNEISECIQENINIARKTGVSVNISHLKVSGKDNWGKSKGVLNLIETARQRGIQITADQYPFKAGSTFLTAVLPQWSLRGGLPIFIERLKSNDKYFKQKIKRDIKTGYKGWDNLIQAVGWENIVINSVNDEGNQRLLGKSLAEIARIWKLDLYETLFKILVEEEGNVSILVFQGDEEDIQKILKSEFIMVGTDGISIAGRPHPRMYGTYPRIIHKYVKEEGHISLARAIKKMTFLPAKTLGLEKRGLIKEGNYADLVVIDLDTIENRANYINSTKYPGGIDMVIVNGRVVLREGKVENKLAGRLLKPSYLS